MLELGLEYHYHPFLMDECRHSAVIVMQFFDIGDETCIKLSRELLPPFMP